MSIRKDECRRIEPLLVEYADGELSCSEQDCVARHVVECAECRRRLHLLRRSLELAVEVWEGAATADDAAKIGTPRGLAWSSWRAKGQQSLRRWIQLSGLAAAVAMWWLAATWRVHDHVGAPGPEMKPEAVRSHAEFSVDAANGARGASGEQGEGNPAHVPADNPDIEQLIAREERLARLEVAYELLAAQPALEDYRRQAEEYLNRVRSSSR